MSLNSITITARHSSGLVETVYSGDPFGAGAFQGPYNNLSSTTSTVTGGLDWNIQRTGGWPGSSVELTIDAADDDGNHTIETIVWLLPVPGFVADVIATAVVEGSLTVDPSVSAGRTAPVGTILPRQGSAELWQKFGLLDTEWRIVGDVTTRAPGSVAVSSGEYLLTSTRIVLTSTQRVQLSGTGRLRIL